MPLNTNIAMGYRGLEIQPQNMLADYAAVQQIQGGRQAQELNQLKMQEYERARTEEEGLRNYLAKADFAKPEARTGLARFGKAGLAYGKALTEQDTAALTQRETLFKLEKAKGDFIAQAKRDTSQNPSDANLTAFKEDLLANPLFTEPEKLRLGANVDRILAMPVGERRAFMASQGASPSELKPSNLQVNQGGQTQVLQMPAFGGAGTSVNTLSDVPLPKAVEEQKARIALAGRPPAQPRVEPAPTVTTVEDPNNPGKFLQVDARQYKGGGAGAPGVIGGARPSATAEKTTIQRAQMGKDLGFAITQLSDITKDGGLIDQSTGSGAGRLVDLAARFGGKALPGDIAIGKIAPIADLVLKMVPRFEGPQSNADTKSYKEAAGQLADSSLPTEIRKAAGRTVLRLMQERKDQFVTTDMATEGTPAAAGAGVDTNNPLLK